MLILIGHLYWNSFKYNLNNNEAYNHFIKSARNILLYEFCENNRQYLLEYQIVSTVNNSFNLIVYTSAICIYLYFRLRVTKRIKESYKATFWKTEKYSCYLFWTCTYRQKYYDIKYRVVVSNVYFLNTHTL